MISLDYLKGVLNTYGYLNMPNANLWCEFDIIEVEKDQEISEVLTKNFGTSDDAIAYINEVSEEYFSKELHKWLFSGELAHRNLQSYRLDTERDIVFSVIKEALNPESFGIFIFNDEAHYKLAVYFDFYLIKNSEKSYILHFIYNG